MKLFVKISSDKRYATSLHNVLCETEYDRLKWHSGKLSFVTLPAGETDSDDVVYEVKADRIRSLYLTKSITSLYIEDDCRCSDQDCQRSFHL